MFDVWHFDNFDPDLREPIGQSVMIRAPYWTGEDPEDAETMAALYAGTLRDAGESGVVVILGPCGQQIGDTIHLDVVVAA